MTDRANANGAAWTLDQRAAMQTQQAYYGFPSGNTDHKTSFGTNSLTNGNYLSMNMPTGVGLTTDPALQQRLFGVINEAGTNVSHVPSGISLPGQCFTFQHARFAVSGADLANLVSQHAAGQPNAFLSMFNHPGISPIYRPDFAMAGLTPTTNTLPLGTNFINNNPANFGMPNLTSAMMPNFASVLTQTLPRSEVQKPSIQMPMGLKQASNWQGASTPTVSKTNDGVAYRTTGVRDYADITSAGAAEGNGQKRKRRKRDPTLPTPARFAWNFYFRDQYTKIRNSEPSEHSNVQKAFTDIGLDLGKKWKSLTKEEKAPYIRMAELDRERYEKELRERLSGVKENSSNSKGDDNEEGSHHDSEDAISDDDGKVAIVLHEVAVEDTRSDADKGTAPTEGELVADVLVVDDDEVFLKIIRHRLLVGQKNPPKVITVTNTEDAKRMILDEHKKFGTILMDKNFGEGQEDGATSLQCIRENGYSGVVVGVTVSEDEQTRKEFEASGADKTFVKGSSSFYDDLLTLVKLHSTHAQMMEKAEAEPTNTNVKGRA